ncbi:MULTISPECIES: hypothetical protein [Myroides]|uniref:Sensor of ECF-type sigma factor n=1 Tax=Myroides albus TaxID=2562892 RepID=A0A6I3LLS4_9FLAO|nr:MULTISPECIES: hypothetical protein [Myroides]MTG97122.1 hypothetical protein [Myroides albus]MVX35145.1 hypothetical protein [Myroides sp. LoEW2-1]UVD78864.1 hypothetical protein NWE55_12140 [Myroides albus]
MKKHITLFFLFICMLSIKAQDHGEQIRSLKIAHLTSVLNLSTTEAEKFWPLYNTYDHKMSELRHNEIVKFLKHNEISEIETMSEKEASKKIQELIDFEEAYFSTRKDFLTEAKKILSNKKILLLKKAEDDFNRKLLRKYKEKK